MVVHLCSSVVALRRYGDADVSSKCQPQPELDPPRRQGAEDPPEVGVGIHARRVRHKTGIRVVEIDEVEGVKGLAPEFHPDPLGEFEIPENGERDLLITWPARPGQRARRVADD